MSSRIRRTVVWSDLAEGDLDELAAFVAADDPRAAAETEDRILVATGGLAAHPRRGRIVPELLELGIRQYRELIITPYRVVYRVADRRVLVLAVLHGARDLIVALHSRFLRPGGG